MGTVTKPSDQRLAGIATPLVLIEQYYGWDRDIA